MERERDPMISHLVPARPCCDGCGATAPETNTDYTLISRSFGWRLTRRKLPSGALTMDWRCAACWKTYKGDRVVAPSAVRPPGDSSPPSPQPTRGSKLVGGLR
jgi:hypothetical protein